METVAESKIDLFADQLPTMEQIQQFSEFVNSSEIERIAFKAKLEDIASQDSAKSAPAVGVGLFIVGEYCESVSKLCKAKDSKEKFMYTAFAQRKLGQYDQSIENLNKSLKFEADPLTVNLEKAAVYRHAKDFEAAAKELKNCANFEKVSAEYHYQLARLQESQAEYTEAVENYKIASELAPEHQKTLFHLAFRCDLSGDEEAAIDYYKQIVSHAPVYINALMNLAVLYEDRNEFDKALRCVLKVLETHPNHCRALLFQKDIESSMTMVYDEEKEQKKYRRNKILETPISDFELSVRSRNCLKKMNIYTIGDLLNISEAELLSYKNFGETSLQEIKVILDPRGLRLGMGLEESDLSATEPSELDSPENQGLTSKPLSDLQLSVRSRKCLERLKMHSIGELIRKTEAELLGCKNFGVTSLNEIKKSLNNLGLSLRTLE